MAHIPYKYTIHERLQKLPKEDYDIARTFLPNKCGVTWQTFKNWIYLKQNDTLEIPGSSILKMAIFFDVHPNEMFSNPPSSKSMKEDWTRTKTESNV